MGTAPLVLTFDLGTQSVRAMIFDDEGNLLAIAKVKYEEVFFSTQPGYAEQHGDFYWTRLCRASKEVAAAYPALMARVGAVCVTTIRDTCVALDREGNCVRPVILFMDNRQAVCATRNAPLKARLALRLVGMTNTVEIQRRITKSNWIKEAEPQNWQKTYKYAMISGFITHRMTGSWRDSAASQVGHVPFDSKRFDWQKPGHMLHWVYDIPRDKLMDLVPAGDLIGHITDGAAAATGIPAGTPVIAGGSDKGCESIGTGVLDDTGASLSFGTMASVQLFSERYVEPIKYLPPYPALVPNAYNLEIQIYRGFWMLTWFIREFAEKEKAEAAARGITPEEVLNEKMAAIPPGSEGLMLQPYWSPSLKDPVSRGSVIGFSDVHTRLHLYRAILEGIGYGLMEALFDMQKRSGYTVKSLTVSGGGAQSPAVCQLIADMFGLPVYGVQTSETSGLGAAMTAFVGLRRYPTVRAAAMHMVHRAAPYTPNAVIHEIYHNLFHKVYRKIYPKLRPLFSDMTRLLPRET
ncbi:MAG: FGGY-family carbohydrate kinase [Clostridiales bacterium]|jgi:sugar (pentulose or hexulose) kinase|nr:FGGY-family carbohydrate kinase [Clostridiales bacterium]